jgi:hypothetical protein
VSGSLNKDTTSNLLSSNARGGSFSNKELA